MSNYQDWPFWEHIEFRTHYLVVLIFSQNIYLGGGGMAVSMISAFILGQILVEKKITRYYL